MAVTYTYTFADYTVADADQVMQNFNDAKTVADTAVQLSGAETIAGVKTFSSAMICGAHLQLAETTTPTNVANYGMLYAKDVAGATELHYQDAAGNEIQITSGGSVNSSVTTTTGADATLANSETLSITHASDTSYKRDFEFYKYVTDHWEVIYDDGGSTWSIKLYDTHTDLVNVAGGTSNVKGFVTVYS